jgi:XTP/dITP diphosphohydrolase
VIIHCGTTNPGKLREFQMAAPDMEIRALSVPPPEEHGETFEETACQKALYYGAQIGGYLFADDSGLEVDALGGAPGVHSARFAGLHATDEANNALLLDKLSRIENRTARFVCAIALVGDGALLQTFRGTVEGRIVDAPRGAGGFGYDPLFYYEPFGCTFGEATAARKMQVSHRARALQAMFTYLRGIASNAETQSSSSRPESSRP